MEEPIKHPVVKTNRTIHMAPQFRPIKRGARRRGLERKYNFKDGSELTIGMMKECDIADQSLLYAILGMVLEVKRGKLLKAKPTDEKLKELRKSLKIEGDVVEYDCLRLVTNKYELNEELGKARNSQNREWILESLHRLSGVNFKYDGNRWVWGFNLLSYAYNKDTDEIHISVNPMSAYVILQNKSFVHIHRQERGALHGDESKALHSVLAGLVNPGQTRPLNADMLADKVYARYDEEISEYTTRHRRTAIKEAAVKINKLKGWKIDVYGRGRDLTLQVTRKKMGG